MTPQLMYFGEVEGSRFVDQEECNEMNAAALSKFMQERDYYPDLVKSIEWVGSSIFYLQEPDVKVYINTLGDNILTLKAKLGWQPIIFLLDYPTPWFKYNNPYPLVQKSMIYLKSIGVTDTFTGGFIADEINLKELIVNLFWMVRCNSWLPGVYFTGPNQECILHICKYGNLHFDFYSTDQKEMIEQKALELGMLRSEDGRCYEHFSETGAIEGRDLFYDRE
jgi:hypothetical protein